MGPGRADQGRPDQEEDGFLLIGETASERNTILPAHHTPNSGYPPSYSQVCLATLHLGSLANFVAQRDMSGTQM